MIHVNFNQVLLRPRTDSHQLSDEKRHVIGVFLIRSLIQIKYQLTIQTQPEIVYGYHHGNGLHVDFSH